MADIADAMIDGALCESCGGLMDDGRSPGYPRKCIDCTKGAYRQVVKDLFTPGLNPLKTNCPTCGWWRSEFRGRIAAAPAPADSPSTAEVVRDAARLDAIEEESWRLIVEAVWHGNDDADPEWCVTDYDGNVLARNRHSLRGAIDAAIAANTPALAAKGGEKT